MAIPLGRPLPDASRDLPGRQRGNALLRHPYLVLLPVGLAVPSPLPETRCALTAPFHLDPRGTRPDGQFVFCGAIPGVASAGRYPAPCSRGARTFLPSFDEQPSGHLTRAECRCLKDLSQSPPGARQGCACTPRRPRRRSSTGENGAERPRSRSPSPHPSRDVNHNRTREVHPRKRP